MTWQQWVGQISDYLLKNWGLSERFAFRAAQLLAYLYYYGLQPQITSGRRTQAEQERLRLRYAQGDPSIVYPPAKNSRHIKGDAIDIKTTDPTAAQYIASYLGIGTVKNDPVHFQLKG